MEDKPWPEGFTYSCMPGEEFDATLSVAESALDVPGGVWLRLRGDFGPAGRPIVAVRLVPR